MVVMHRRHRTRSTVRRRSTYNSRSDKFESVGPLGERTRGSTSQIAERYRQLAQDTSSRDRTLSQDYLQHAEHYSRLSAPSTATKANSTSSYNNRDTQMSTVHRTNDPTSLPQPEIDEYNDSDDMNPEQVDSKDMQSILPPTIPSTDNRWSSVRTPYSRRRRRYQPSEDKD